MEKSTNDDMCKKSVYPRTPSSQHLYSTKHILSLASTQPEQSNVPSVIFSVVKIPVN